MVFEKWFIGLNKKSSVTKTAFSLTSPRGTSSVRRKRNSYLGVSVNQSVEIVSIVFLMTFVLVMAILLLAIAPFTTQHRGLTTKEEVLSPGSLFSKFQTSVQRMGSNHRPRGKRFYEYWEDEKHTDFEPYPWKHMKDHSRYKETLELTQDGPDIPESMDAKNAKFLEKLPDSIFNDPSPFYARLRQSYEAFFPFPKEARKPSDLLNDVNIQRALEAVQDLQTYLQLETHLEGPNPSLNSTESNGVDKNYSLFYDIHNCPDEPPPGYPMEWNLMHKVLSQWPADDPEIPASGKLYQGLCVFDLQKDYDSNYAKAIRYRNSEVPFVVKGDPNVAQTVERWNAPHYLEALIGDLPQVTEISNSGTFTYWTRSGVDNHKYPASKYPSPNELKEMTFTQWLRLANVTDPKMLSPESPHYYFRIVGCSPGEATSDDEDAIHQNVDNSCTRLPGEVHHANYLADELPFYSHTQSSLYVKDPLLGKTANKATPSSKILMCRFGMKGVMATNHFDGERNFVTVLSGERRYILAHPKECGNMALYPFGHPSARHSAVDWAHPNLLEHPEFEDAMGNEVVLQAGDSLFIPSLWFHYIVSMSMNIQCNTRSGLDERYVKDLYDSCGW